MPTIKKAIPNDVTQTNIKQRRNEETSCNFTLPDAIKCTMAGGKPKPKIRVDIPTKLVYSASSPCPAAPNMRAARTAHKKEQIVETICDE